nr:uncharacterized protein LOC128671493 [Plodia interpunctella]
MQCFVLLIVGLCATSVASQCVTARSGPVPSDYVSFSVDDAVLTPDYSRWRINYLPRCYGGVLEVSTCDPFTQPTIKILSETEVIVSRGIPRLTLKVHAKFWCAENSNGFPKVPPVVTPLQRS